ncbi:MAG: glycosyltransferase [Chloroflexi bacterium]|nr:glycosyltransferase [Chloroflexota bacterium]
MKILLLTPILPYPSESGVAIRNIGIIRGLAQAGQRITVLSFAEHAPDRDANPLYQLCDSVRALPLPAHGKRKRIAKLLLSRQADIAIRLASEDFARTLTAILRENAFGLIQFAGIELGCYLPLIQADKKNAKVVYDAQNAEAELQRVVAQIDRQRPRRWPAAVYSTLQTERLSRFEGAICSGVDAVIAVSDEDRAYLIKHGGAPVYVMPNGITADDYAPPADATREPFQLVFSGKMDYRPNVDAVEWFHHSVFPLVREQFPETRLVIVGRNPHRRLASLAADEGVQVTGWVDSVQPYLHRATIYVAPLRMGSGTRLKILQAMAARCAVVSTSIGAAGLNDSVQSALSIADGAEDFAEKIVSLLADESRRRALGQLAQDQVRRHYDWSALIPRLLRDYREIGLG